MCIIKPRLTAEEFASRCVCSRAARRNRDVTPFLAAGELVEKYRGINEFPCQPSITGEIISKLIEGNRFTCGGEWARVIGGKRKVQRRVPAENLMASVVGAVVEGVLSIGSRRSYETRS